jgi:hypothetical protein
MRLRSPIRRTFSKPQDVAPDFTHLDEAAFAGGNLKRLRFHHGSFFPCMCAPGVLDCILRSFRAAQPDVDFRFSARIVLAVNACESAPKTADFAHIALNMRQRTMNKGDSEKTPSPLKYVNEARFFLPKIGLRFRPLPLTIKSRGSSPFPCATAPQA